jgi:tight adherence protein C
MAEITRETMQLLALCAASGGALAAGTAWLRLRRAADPTVPGASDDAEPTSLLRRLASPLAMRLRPSRQSELELLQTRLLRAGRRQRSAVDRYLEEKLLALLGGLFGGIFLGGAVGGSGGFFLMLGCMLLGIIGPDRVIDARGTRRREAVAAGLPGAVDLLVTCLDAGLSLEQAISRVSHDLAHSSPTLAEELRITASEFEAGVALPDALRRLARRVGLDDLAAMCGVVAQAHALGAPVAHTLREYAVASRRQRMSMLEERAGKLSTQLTIPLALFLLPAAMLMILGPAALQLVRAFK